ncbi:MAG: BACON domain-containing protein [Phycisphaerae bacterium]
MCQFRLSIKATSLVAGILCQSCILATAVGQVFPGTTWEFKTPTELGLDAAKLDQIAGTIGGSGCIVRHGYMVKTWGSQSLKGDWASASKPVISTLLFFAIEEGRIAGVDAMVKDYGWSLSTKDQPMTFRHMANMIGNYTRAEAPGAAWAYNDYNIQLYVKTLFDRVYGQNANTVALAPNRLGALQFQDGSLIASNNRLNTSVRDFARIGWFWANKGYWNGTRLLPQHYFDDYMKPQVSSSLPKTTAVDPAGDYLSIGTYGGGSDQTPYGPGIYGFNWWFNATGALHPTSITWPDAPADTFQANGHWGREVVTVMPGLGIVMAYFNGVTLGFEPGNPGSSSNQVLKLLAESVLPTAPLIMLNRSQISRSVDLGGTVSDDTFTVSNGGAGTLKYAITVDRDWLHVAPSEGTSTGEADTITVSFTVGDLAIGTHTATITVADDGSVPPASNTSQTVAVTVDIRTVLPDLDLDGDVDQEDFGLFQVCLTGEETVPSPCVAADFDRNEMVNQSDLTLLLSCLSGAGALADVACDDAYQ